MSDGEGMGNRPQQRANTGRAWRRSDLRHGYTTSACAAAAAAAATQALLTGHPLTHVTIDLPAEAGVTFALSRCELDVPAGGQVTCGVVKDAGDDPDVTHGAEIVATVRWGEAAGVHLTGGPGVGVVTRPGLPVPVGQPAINPGAARIIRRAVEAAAGAATGQPRDDRGLVVTISVPDGEALARKTLNPTLGIVGGISILGTDGIVRPYSQGAYRASIRTQMKVARENDLETIVLTTGVRSEEYARQHIPALPALACVQVGDHMDYALRQARQLKFARIIISGMVGKLSKLAQGRMQTHVSEGSVDLAFLAQLADALGADAGTVRAVAAANTAHHVQVILKRVGIAGLEGCLAELAAAHAAAFIAGSAEITILVWSMGGELLATAGAPAVGPTAQEAA